MAENNTLTTTPPPPRRPAGFQKGVSGNPGGRPKGLAEKVRQTTKDGQVLIALFMRIVEGKRVNGDVPTTADIIRAAEWLADRGWGRPVQAIDSSSPVTVIIAGGWDAE